MRRVYSSANYINNVQNEEEEVKEEVREVKEEVREVREVREEVREEVKEKSVPVVLERAISQPHLHYHKVHTRKYLPVSYECLFKTMNSDSEDETKYAKIGSHNVHPRRGGEADKGNGIDLRSYFPVPFDQGQNNLCSANALSSMISYDIPNFLGSQLFLYHNENNEKNERISKGNNDSEFLISDGIKTLLEHGICSENDWPYDISKINTRPNEQCYQNALEHRSINVKPLKKNMGEMKNALRNGYPFVAGIILFNSFQNYEVASTGMVCLPSRGEVMLGGHVVICVGFNETKKVWIMRNSWGEHWGDNGYFYLPYDYLLSNLGQELWCITKMKI